MSTDEHLEGYSLRRNGTCLDNERDCGGTWRSFRRCCPGNTHCPAEEGAPGICCPTTKNCEAALNNKARCANSTADLYNVQKTEGYFCCTDDTLGVYTVSRGYVGCAEAQDVNHLGEKVKTGVAAVQYTISTSTSSNTATATTLSSSTPGTISATPTPTNNANTDTSHSNTGAIAGGVVGGIAGVVILIGLAWCLFRRRRKHPQDSQYIQPPPGPVSELSDSNRITELSGQSVVELPGSEHRKLPPAELAT
ncbi:hypothetical protein N7536_000924 [Penicillium majusculum]|uniref:Mid2 domain-containing protein n=1 Tax=Penicillium solitum TaxID=60172 RepID=A0A1V6R761_9EURO|nr:uncharacterized protein PENSOL_c013G06348 [Penicillium solitum]KAJ5705235.1 hypothetical protein N7536_000924 [Penicillium majusculum]OQD97157.1 hypothetical protein PENSOL_c013G06348 [Penicillium solitum]